MNSHNGRCVVIFDWYRKLNLRAEMRGNMYYSMNAFFLLTSRCYYVSEMFRMPFMLHVWLLGCFSIFEFDIMELY